MSLFLLDTDILTLFRNGNEAVVRHVLSVPADRLFVSAITVEEQIQGWYKILHRQPTAKQTSEMYQRLADTVSFFSDINILNFSEKAIERNLMLDKLKLNIGKNDLRIAAIALENNATVVTRNLRDFGQVPGLAIEDWSAE